MVAESGMVRPATIVTARGDGAVAVAALARPEGGPAAVAADGSVPALGAQLRSPARANGWTFNAARAMSAHE